MLALDRIKWIVFNQGKDRFCPVCERHSKRFVKYGTPPRTGARCQWCGSLERHRLFWSVFAPIEHKGKILHISPAKCIEKKIRKETATYNYLTADLHGKKTMMIMDITNIRYPDECFDTIICNAVLEHVADDIRAISELYRVTKYGGVTIISVPLSGVETVEKNKNMTDSEIISEFGQLDHVRRCGEDYKDRIISAGFRVTEVSDQLVNSRKIFMCHKGRFSLDAD